MQLGRKLGSGRRKMQVRPGAFSEPDRGNRQVQRHTRNEKKSELFDIGRGRHFRQLPDCAAFSEIPSSYGRNINSELGNAPKSRPN